MTDSPVTTREDVDETRAGHPARDLPGMISLPGSRMFFWAAQTTKRA